jgi:hypothetical protein
VRPRGSHSSSRFRRKRLWPWAVLALVLLGLAGWELSARRMKERAPVPAQQPGQVAAETTRSSSIHGKEGKLSGFVVSPGGERAAGVLVSVAPVGAETTTDSIGAFQLDVEDGATVQITAHHSDIGIATTEVVVPATGIELRLVPRAGLDVQVASRARGVEGAKVIVAETELRTIERFYEADQLTNVTGKIRILGLPPGHLLVRAVDPATGASGSTEVMAREGEILPVTVSLPIVRDGGVF